jgi:hypothetical protein
MLFDAEDDEAVIQKRLADILRHYKADFDQLGALRSLSDWLRRRARRSQPKERAEAGRGKAQSAQPCRDFEVPAMNASAIGY